MGNGLASLTRQSAWPSGLAPRPMHAGGKELGARLLAFLIPVLIAIEVPGLGTIYLAELGLIGLLPVLLVLRGRLLQSKALAFILAMGLLYLSAQVLTDIIRETPFGDYARGWSRIIFFLCCFVSAFLLIGHDRTRLLCFAIGLVVGAFLFLLINFPITSIGWKFGFAGPITTLVLISFSLVPVLRSPRSLVGPMVLAALGIFSAFMDFRSWGGVLLISAAFLSVPAILRMIGLRPKPLSYSRLLMIGTLLLAAGFGALKLYGIAAEAGMLGEKSKAKYETQSALGDLGVLLGGRSESLVTVQAIQDSPLIGHGSWAKDRYYAELRQLMLYRLGFLNRFIEPKNDLIPTHSHLLGSWVEAGIAGALFWVGVLALIIAALRRLYASDDPLRPYMVFLMFLFIWDILFSPFGAQRRLTNGFLMVVLLFALNASAMNWRQRSSGASQSYDHERPGSTQMVDMGYQPGLAEPPMAPWETVNRQERAAVAGINLTPRREQEKRLKTSMFDDDPAFHEDGVAFQDSERLDDQEMAEDQEMADDQERESSIELASSRETIRAGFRRLRERRP